jgi:hypothetical protein
VVLRLFEAAPHTCSAMTDEPAKQQIEKPSQLYLFLIRIHDVIFFSFSCCSYFTSRR